MKMFIISLFIIKTRNILTGCYILQGTVVTGSIVVSSSMAENDATKLWHMRLGHMSEKGLHLLSKQGYLGKHVIGKLDFANTVLLGNKKRLVSLQQLTVQKVFLIIFTLIFGGLLKFLPMEDVVI